MITRKELLELSKVQETTCISIFIPAHRAGQATLEGEDVIQLKNQLKEVRKRLEEEKIEEHKIESFEKPLHDLIEDSEFWRNQSDGLAIFLSDGLVKTYTVPISFEPTTYISNEFYLLPLISLFNEEGIFYLLSLATREVRLYEGNKYAITEIDIKDLVPGRLEDAVGYDYEQKTMTFDSQKGDKGEASFHGHDGGQAEEKAEMKLFFRAINDGLMKILKPDEKPPMIICALDSHFALYKEVNTYKNLFPDNLSGNPADIDPISMHDEAKEMLHSHFTKDRNAKKELFHQALSNGRASTNIQDIVPAALDGRIDTLFVKKGSDLYGIYDATRQKTEIREKNERPNVSILNLIALKTFDQGGNIYFEDDEGMPDETVETNAIYRY